MQRESVGVVTAECDVCGGRYRLDGSGLVPPHTIPVPLHSQLELLIAA
jgi:hypothetical protein